MKEYRRMLQAMVDKLPKHSTGFEEAASIARDKLIRANQGVYGKGTYWGLDKFPTNYGNTTIVKNNVGDIRSVGDPERPSWGLHRTDVGTPIERKDLMVLKENNPHSVIGRRVATAAREARMRVVSPSAYQAAGLAAINKSFRAEMGSPSGKRDLILSAKKLDRRWKRLTPP